MSIRSSRAWRCAPPTVAVVAMLLFSLSAAAADAERPDTGVAPAQDVELFFHAYGSGAPLLVLNGGPGVSSAHFGDLGRRLAALEPGYRTILFDQRGTGRSTLDVVDAETVNVAAMVADIEALRRHLGIERWAVLGHSWGGMYAMLYATAHPERVDGLLLSASGGADLEWLDYVGANIRKHMGPERRAVYVAPAGEDEDPAAANRRRVEAMAAAYVYDPDNIPFVVSALTREGADFPAVRGLVYQDLDRIGYDLTAALSTLETPALVLQGRQDLLGEAVPLRIHAALRHSELVWLDECAHYPWLDAPQPYFAAIERFLATGRETTGEAITGPQDS